MEMEQKGPKLVDARGMAVRLQKAVSAEEEQEWQVLMESVGCKSGRLERVSAWNGNGQETVEKNHHYYTQRQQKSVEAKAITR